MKPVKAIKDPEAFKVFADETRRRIVDLLRLKEMTVSQIAAEINITHQSVSHHMKKLQKAEMVEVVREERIDHLIERYYRATAETFFFSVGKTPRSAEIAKELVTTVLNGLRKLGFEIKFDESKISQLVDTELALVDYYVSQKFEDIEDEISELDNVDFLAKRKLRKYARTLSMSDKELDELHGIERRFEALLRSLLENEV